MVVLRRTRKLASVLPASAKPSAQSETALGDWYVNRTTVDRRPLLLLLSAHALLPILLPARDVRSLPDRLSDIVTDRLRRLGVRNSIIDAEVAAMESVAVGQTTDRSVVGIMVDFAKALPLYLEPDLWDDTTLAFVEARLAETPCHAGRRLEEVVFPARKAVELLKGRWGAA